MNKKILVAVIDSGVDKKDSYLAEKEIVDLYYEGKEFKSCYAGKINPHGTEIIKVLLKESPNIKVLSIRTLQEDNRCMLSAIIRSIEYCIQQNVDIINLSLGSCSSSSKRLKELQEVCDKATARGIVIFAADNNIPHKKSYPANFNNVIGVTTPDNAEDFCRVSYENVVVEFSDNFVYIPDHMRCIVRKGNSYLCPLLVGLFCRFVDGKIPNSNMILSFLEFLNDFSKNENISRIYFNKYDIKEQYSLNGKNVLFFADDMDLNNLQMYSMYQEVCNIRQCFKDIYYESFDKVKDILKGIDIFFIGALTNQFIHENKAYLRKLVSLLLEEKIEIITVFPIINTYERMLLTENGNGYIKSIYK